MIKSFSILLANITSLLILLTIPAATSADEYLSPETIDGSMNINAEALIQLARDDENLIIIDSRIKSDRRQGYISGSISLPDTDTSCATLFPLIDNKETATVFYCNGPKCRRSDRAVITARECGYKNLYWFRGGFEEWISKNYLISK